MQQHADEVLAEPERCAAQRLAQSRRLDRRRLVEDRLADPHQGERHRNAAQNHCRADGVAAKRVRDAAIVAVEAALRVRYQAQLDDANPDADCVRGMPKNVTDNVGEPGVGYAKWAVWACVPTAASAASRT